MSPNDDWRKYPQITNRLPRLGAGNYWTAKYVDFHKEKQTLQLDEHIDSNTHSGASFWFQCSAMQLCQQLQWEYIQYGTGKDSSHKKGLYWEETKAYFYVTKKNDSSITTPTSVDYYRTEGTVTTDAELAIKPYYKGKVIPNIGKWITYYHQISDDEYEYIRVKQPINLQFVFGFGWMIYDATSPNFLVPLSYNSIRDMSLVKWTNASQWASNLKYTTFQTVKEWG